MNSVSESEKSSLQSSGDPTQGAEHFVDETKLLQRISLILAFVWTLLLGVSLYMNVQMLFDNAEDMAHRKAVEHFNKEMALRLWGVSKGGVYLNTAKNSPPIEYLDFLPNRDVAGPNGTKLTLYDPATMLRQLTTQQGELYGVAGHIVGEVPFNPLNFPDPWEQKALEAFRHGAKEVHEIAEKDGKQFVRIMRPMPFNAPCLMCHAKQGYKLGDIRAGISLSVALDEFTIPAEKSAKVSALSHGGMWLLGIFGILFGHKRVRHHLDAQMRHMADIELSARVFDDGMQAIMITDSRGKILRVNSTYTKITGYESSDVVGRSPSILKSGEHNRAFYATLWESLLEKGSWVGEIQNRHKNGSIFTVLETVSVVHDKSGNILFFISIFQDISEQKESQERIRKMALYDKLTGLPNRQLFSDTVHSAIEQVIISSMMTHSFSDSVSGAIKSADKTHSSLALLHIDLARFKKINDAFGHGYGDKLLVAVAARLHASIGTAGMLARLGGDEFVLLVEKFTFNKEVDVIAEKIVRAMSVAIQVESRDCHVGACIGISLYPQDGSDVETLLKHADNALQKAKSEGVDRYCFFSEEMANQAANRMKIEGELRNAIEREEFVLHYQPQMEISSKRIVGVEALIRWPLAGKMVSPLDFIPIAEETGLIIPLGRWIVRAACKEIQRISLQLHTAVRVAVNISAIELNQSDFVDYIASVLASTGLPPAQLELEITESTAMDEIEKTIVVLNKLVELGVSLAIDDFGTGHSSLNYLKRLPVHCLKIDRAFVRDIPEDQNDSAIVRTIITMTRTFNLQVVAEGVETQEQLDFLQQEGCNIAQGYLLSKPIPPDALERFLEAHLKV